MLSTTWFFAIFEAVSFNEVNPWPKIVRDIILNYYSFLNIVFLLLMESLFLSLGWWLHPGLLCHRDFDPRFSFVLGSIPATRQSRSRKHPDSLHPPFTTWTSCPAFWRRASIRFEENIIVVKGCFKDNIIISVIKCNKNLYHPSPSSVCFSSERSFFRIRKHVHKNILLIKISKPKAY